MDDLAGDVRRGLQEQDAVHDVTDLAGSPERGEPAADGEAPVMTATLPVMVRSSSTAAWGTGSPSRARRCSGPRSYSSRPPSGCIGTTVALAPVGSHQGAPWWFHWSASSAGPPVPK